MGGMKSNLNDKLRNNNILKLSKFKNIFLKFSGYNYVLGEGRRWDFPYNDALWVYKEAYQKFGSNMVWGSDFPVVNFLLLISKLLRFLINIVILCLKMIKI